MAGSELCGVCGKDREYHRQRDLKHAFSAEGRLIPAKGRGSSQSSGPLPGAQGSAGTLLRGDPILRLALIRNGAVTVEELNAIEAELQASGVAYANPNPRTDGEDAGDRAAEGP